MKSDFKYAPVFLEAAKAGGEIIRGYFGQQLAAMQKSTAADLRTKADLESEAVILPILEKAFPDFNILSEERGHTERGSEYTLVVDPLDGTHNFSLGIPNFTVIIALLYRQEAIAGLIYHPMIDLACYAEKGKGAFKNGVQIRVNQESDSTRSSIAYTASYHNAGADEGVILKTLDEDLDIKRFVYNWSGAADSCLLASGTIEALINDGNEIYDFVASKVICREAGAKITDITGKIETDDTKNVFLISNGTSLHERVLASWKKARP